MLPPPLFRQLLADRALGLLDAADLGGGALREEDVEG
jgi:hypothetical protein